MSYTLRVSGSIEPFRQKALDTWGIQERDRVADIRTHSVFFGMYHIGDYASFVRHRGKRSVLWAGSDINNLTRGYAFSDGDDLWLSKMLSFVPWQWIFKIFKADHYCENQTEQSALLGKGIIATVIPSFLEDVSKFEVTYKHSDNPQVYISAREGRADEYGHATIERIASKTPGVTFHFYGIKRDSHDNIIYHGLVPPEQFNKDIKGYQACIRANKFDGFSELVAKAFLQGQYVISRIPYLYAWQYHDDYALITLLNALKEAKKPNIEAREYWSKKFNNYPWNSRKHRTV